MGKGRAQMQVVRGGWVPVCGALLCTSCSAASPVAAGSTSTEVVLGGPPLPLETVQSAASAMLIQKPRFGQVHIVQVTRAVDGWAVAALRPPYRDFPNVVVFRFDGNHWRPLEEGLLLGVQPYRSPALDLHTVGVAFDYSVGTKDLESAQDVVDQLTAMGKAKGLVTVAYRRFFHSHLSGRAPYHIDRRFAEALALKLFGSEYSHFPASECTMFDVPEIDRVSLTQEGDSISLNAKTQNGQIWTVQWRSDETSALRDKVVDAEWASADRGARAFAQNAPPVVKWATLVQQRWLQHCERIGTPASASGRACIDEVAAKLVPNECVRQVMVRHSELLECESQALATLLECVRSTAAASNAESACERGYASACKGPTGVEGELAECEKHAE